MKLPSYKKQKPEGNYDVIIIGSGIGALCTGSLLARKGYKVLILERHYTAGGFTHVFKRKKYEWDVGIHYIGEVVDEHTIMYKMFDYLSDGNLKWADMGDVYDKIIFGDEVYDFRKGVTNFKDQLKAYFPAPKDQQAIDDYVDLVFASTSGVRNFFMEKALPKPLSFVAGPFLRGKMLRYAKLTTREVLEQLTDNVKLRGVLAGQYGDYGLPPSESSFVIHSMIAKHYFKGGAYPVGGSSQILDTIAPSIQRAGGEIFTNAPVAEILTRNGVAYGVKMEDGHEIEAPVVISNAGIDVTYGQLLSNEEKERFGLKSQLTEIEPSASHVSLYIGLQHTAEELGLQKANLWVYPGYDHDKNLKNFLQDDSAPLPLTYVSFPGAKDPDFTNRFPGRTTIEIVGMAPYQRFKKWEDERWMHRGDNYEAYKEQLSQRMLDVLYRYVPQVQGKIDHYELSTPLSTKHFVNYQHGEIYGIAHTPERFRLKWLRPKTPIKNLFLTGQDVVTAGIGGALFSGVLTATAVAKTNLMSDIFKHQPAVQQL